MGRKCVDSFSTFGYHGFMDIKKDLEQFLAETGWNVPRLVAETGVNKDSIYRLLNESRKGLGCKSLEKLWPYLYGDKRPNPEQAPKEAA